MAVRKKKDDIVEIPQINFDEMIKKMIKEEVTIQLAETDSKEVEKEVEKLKEEIDIVISKEVKRHLSDACSILINKLNGKF